MIFDDRLVSIIMPAYNAGKYIDEAVQSVIAQTWQTWELIIVNDGSTDNTVEYLKGIKDHRITIIHQENKGVSAARNTALKIAKGAYISFLDSDDLLTKRSVEHRVNYLQRNKDIDIVDGCVSVRSENLEIELRYYEPYYNGKLLLRLLSLDSKVFFSIAPYIMRRHCTEGLFFHENMTHAEDLLYYTEMSIKRNVVYGFTKEKVYIYRKRNKSAMSNLDNFEKGYFDYLNYIKSAGIRFNLINLLRIRVAKILFLSWLSERKIYRATRAVIYCFS